jgi:hypothetical protein
MKTLFAIAAYAALAPLAAGQHQLRPHPADAEVPVPNVKYESPFSGYVSYREQDIAPWRDVNDEVSKIGGHTGIVGGAGHSARAPVKPDAKAPAKSSPPSSPGIHGPEHK